MAVRPLAPAPGAADGQPLLVHGLRVGDVEEGVHLLAWPFDCGVLRWENSRTAQGRAGGCRPASARCGEPPRPWGAPPPRYGQPHPAAMTRACPPPTRPSSPRRSPTTC